MEKITFRPERNFAAKRPQQIAAMNALVEAQMQRVLDEPWYCGNCGLVPSEEIRRESPQATTGVCGRCGAFIDVIPF